jgi:hypothetical protein
MADYLARAELHGANGDDYQTLHQGMHIRMSVKFIAGNRWELPAAEYFSRSATLSASDVRDLAIAPAKQRVGVTGSSMCLPIVPPGSCPRFAELGNRRSQDPRR